MTYDPAGKMTAIDAAGTANDATFTFDALGRFRTRVLAGSTDTYSYAGTSETVVRISNSSGPTVTDSIVSPAGDRLGTARARTVNWLLPDLHGNVGASHRRDRDDRRQRHPLRRLRETIGTGSAGGTRVGDANWKYQGRLDVSPAGLATPLYDMSARFYSPGLGAFTQFDSVMGSAQNPLEHEPLPVCPGQPGHDDRPDRAPGLQRLQRGLPVPAGVDQEGRRCQPQEVGGGQDLQGPDVRARRREPLGPKPGSVEPSGGGGQEVPHRRGRRRCTGVAGRHDFGQPTHRRASRRGL